MNLKKEEYENVLDFSVDDERIIKYLKGETLEVEDLVSSKEKGWYLVCVDGYPLGFGKLSGQMLKNKYLPGMAVAVIMKLRLDKYLTEMGCGTRSQVKKEILKGSVPSMER